MPNYISDSSKTHWMVSNPARTTRTGMDGKPFRCPFCPGNEADTPPESHRVGDISGWQIRVFPNLFPITELHEVVVHSPDHEKNIEDFTLEQVGNILKTYINRFNFLKPKGKVFIFHNYSLSAGASLAHPHSQITVVPNEIPTNTLVSQPVVNIIEQNNNFVAYCPEYSEWSFETWIVGVGHDRSFEELNENQIKDLAKILQSSIRKLKKIHDGNSHFAKKPFGYNYYIFIPQDNNMDSRFRGNDNADKSNVIPLKKGIHDFSNKWHLRIIPRFMERAGFELATGVMVNSVEAKQASEELKKIV